MNIEVTVEARTVLRGIDQLVRETPKVAREAVNLIANSAAKAARAHVSGVFDTPGGKFLAGSFKSRREGSTVFIGPRPSSVAARKPILDQHEDRTLITANDPKVRRLSSQGKLAVPGSQKRSRRGKVRKTPKQLLSPGGKGFVSKSGLAIVERVGKRKLRVAFGLTSQATTPGNLSVVKTILNRIEQRWPTAITDSIEKLRKKALPNSK